MEADERHHKDGDEHNNERSNVVFVCRPCHRELDGRSQRKWADTSRPTITCANCGRVTNDYRRGRCKTCAEFFRRTGRERGT